MTTRDSSFRNLFGFRGHAAPRDYLARRRRSRLIFDVVMIVLLSVLVAGFIIYNSMPGGFRPPGQ
jgi:hypothetical protein